MATVLLVVEAPPATVVGYRYIAFNTAVLIERIVVLLTSSKVAEMVALASCVTCPAVTGNVTELLPDAIVTDAGTEAAELSLVASSTTVPSAGAGPVNVTVPFDIWPLA